jgi:hypothetical protein
LRSSYNAWFDEKHDTKDSNRSASESWWKYYTEWKWVERANAFDDMIDAERHEDELRLREEARRERRAILRGMKAQLAQAVKQLKPDRVSWKDVKDFANVVLTQEREEYDELPVQKTETAGVGGGPIQSVDLAALRELSDEQLEQIIAIAARLEGGGGDGEDEA